MLKLTTFPLIEVSAAVAKVTSTHPSIKPKTQRVRRCTNILTAASAPTLRSLADNDPEMFFRHTFFIMSMEFMPRLAIVLSSRDLQAL